MEEATRERRRESVKPLDILGQIDQVEGGLEVRLLFPNNQKPVFLSLRGHDEVESCAAALEQIAASLRELSPTHEVLAEVLREGQRKVCIDCGWKGVPAVPFCPQCESPQLIVPDKPLRETREKQP